MLHPYLRLIRFHAPIGTLLLVLPCFWALLVAGAHVPQMDYWFFVYFAAGAFLMRSGGCIINDIWDRKIDAQVARTKNRPLASGQVSLVEAFILLGIFLAGALYILLKLPLFAIQLGILALLPVAIYPLAKRVTYLPQLVLALTFNLGVLIAWASVLEMLDWSAFLLYLAAAFWTLGYDTIYACQDAKDDEKIGVKSTALLWRGQEKKYLRLCYGAMMACLWLVGIVEGAELTYYIGWVIVLILLMRQVHKLDVDSKISCLRSFKAGKWIGLWVLLMVFAGIAYPALNV